MFVTNLAPMAIMQGQVSVFILNSDWVIEAKSCSDYATLHRTEGYILSRIKCHTRASKSAAVCVGGSQLFDYWAGQCCKVKASDEHFARLRIHKSFKLLWFV